MTLVHPSRANQSVLAPILGILWFAMIINLLLALFNIIPIPPLDGHWILYGLLPANAAATLERMGSYGFILLYALMFMGIFQVHLHSGWHGDQFAAVGLGKLWKAART